MNTKPCDYFKEFLETQMSGLTGHIEEAGYPFNKVEWGKDDFYTTNENPNWWVYEQTAYWLDGFVSVATLLDDKETISRASKIIYNVLNNPDEDGYLGPKHLKDASNFNRWPHVVFFRACLSLYEYNHDKTIIDKITFHYLNSPSVYVRERNVLNVEIMLLLYSINKEPRLLFLAEQSYLAYNAVCKDNLNDKFALSNKKPYAHGVSYDEYSKIGAMLYMYTSKEIYLKASIKAFKKIDKYFMLIDGLHCSNEFLISNGVMQSHETCCISDYTRSMYYMYLATKNTNYLDKIEKCIFNAGLGSISDDFRALQYFSCVNQLVLDKTSNHNLFFRGSSWMSYRPNPGTECCPGNVNRFMPYYIKHMYLENKNEIFVNLYGASKYSNSDITIIEKTNYPFDNHFSFEVKCNKSFDLNLRIPSFAKKYNISYENIELIHEGYITLHIQNNCTFNLDFECDLISHQEKNYIYFTKGILVYSYSPGEIKEIDLEDKRSSKEFPAYNIYPKNEWAYGVSKDCKIIDNNDSTLSLEVYKLSNWHLKKKKKVDHCINLYIKQNKKSDGDFTFTPDLPKNPIKENENKIIIKLIPYGKTMCRITAFPFLD